MNTYLESMSFRHACKAFDPSKGISDENKKMILEFARLSPSSFGLEPWHFLAINDPKTKTNLRPACWNQEQITSSSLLVVVISPQAHFFRGETEFLKQRIRRKEFTEEQYAFYSKLILSFLGAQNTGDWIKRQSYIALSNMLTGAASLGIDSCALEGFESEKVKEVLKGQVDWNQYDLSVMAAFGYRKNEAPPKIREASSSVITWI